MPSAIVTSTYRYKRPATEAEGGPVGGAGGRGQRRADIAAVQRTEAASTRQGDRKPAIVTAAKRGRRPKPETEIDTPLVRR